MFSHIGGGRSGISQTTWICYRIWVGLSSDTFPNLYLVPVVTGVSSRDVSDFQL